MILVELTNLTMPRVTAADAGLPGLRRQVLRPSAKGRACWAEGGLSRVP